jgi:5-carboxymethyl-2-hydroxymuconate isomerase
MRERTDISDLIDCVHAAALSTEVFPEGGLRTRLAEFNHYRIADDDPANAFVHVVVRMGSGRDAATKRRTGERIFDALCGFLSPTSDVTPMGLSLEVQEIDPEFSFKKNNLHEYVRLRKATVR